MDVEKIQKINDLALKLQQQGGFEREEAVKQAEQMLSKNNNNLEVNEISDQKVKEMDEKKPEQPQNSITWQEAMKKNTDFIVRQFKDIQKEIVSMKAEMDNLNNKIKNIKLAPPPSPPQEKKAESQSELPKKEEGQKQESHPRQGDCQPKDYSVEKYFYCGNK